MTLRLQLRSRLGNNVVYLGIGSNFNAGSSIVIVPFLQVSCLLLSHSPNTPEASSDSLHNCLFIRLYSSLNYICLSCFLY